MQLLNGTLRLSASDVANHLACRHLTELNRAVSEGRLEWPHFDDSGVEALKQRGFEHERQYIEHLRTRGLKIEVIEEGLAGADKTADAMKRGVDVIVQAVLARDRWFGKADVLRKVGKESNLGPFSYEPYDTKLAKEAKGSAVLQLCLYCDILETFQGKLPESFHIVPPGVGFEPQTFRTRDVFSYYRLVKKHLEVEVDGPWGSDFRHYPDPVEFCEVCQWGQRCDQRRRKDDHLSLVASITRGQRRELTDRNVVTLEGLAGVPLPLLWKPERGSMEALTRTAEQARIQSKSRKAGKALYEFLAVEEERGFRLLPEPSTGDIFFDIEGDPFVGTGGLEYLFGYAVNGAKPSYESLWAFNAAAEKAMFETFVDRVMGTWERHPGMHVYHYAPYEPSAMKRLMGRYGTREDEVDRMLRGRLFVDLFRVVRQSVRVGIESYSIKRLEPLLEFKRDVMLDEAGDARHELELSLELGGPGDVTAEIKKLVEGYNRDDCLSALRLRDWLEEKRSELLSAHKDIPIPRPERKSGDASEAVQVASAATKAIFDRLLQDVPADPAQRSDEQKATWLLAQLLDFHRREDKTVSWECRRLAEMDDEELFDERAALSGLEFVTTVTRKRVPIDRYTFPPQDCDLDVETDVFVPDNDWGRPFGKVTAFDPGRGTIDVKKRSDTATEHPKAIYGFTKFPTDVHRAALLRLGTWVATAQAADNLILLGDPRQLERPIKGSHPEGAAASALEHFLGSDPTVPEDLGLFLGETYRLHPTICQLTSELFYDDRLHPTPGRERQAISGTQGFDGAGIWYVPVEHEGNQSSSPEEVAAIRNVVDRLLHKGAAWTNNEDQTKPLLPSDVLIVAPYNAQVNRLARALPGFEIGTVDKFQGQEAPVVIISMTSSSAEDAPRGMEFLYSPNRFNVATSRAKCACIVVASPLLFEPDCRSPKQMKLANALCRYRELAQVSILSS